LAQKGQKTGLFWRGGVVALAYFSAGWLGLELHSQISNSVTSFWAPAGIAVASVLLWGRWMLVGVFLGALAVNGVHCGSWGGAPIIGVGNTAEAAIISEALRRFFALPGTIEFTRFRDELAFAGWLLGGCAVAAAVGATVVTVREGGPWLQVLGTWWTGDLFGVFLFAPLILLLGARRRHGGIHVEDEDSYREREGARTKAALTLLRGNAYLSKRDSTALGHHLPWAGDSGRVLGEVEEFLTGARSVPEPDRVLATVMFTDIVGSTERAAELGDARWRELLSAHQAALRRELMRFRGREVKTLGDGCLATFDGPARAIRCGRAIAEAARSHGLEVRIGIHSGEVELMEEDVGGIAVHIAGRVGALAAAGEVLVTSTVRDLAAGSGIRFVGRGAKQLKGIDEEWQLFAATPERILLRRVAVFAGGFTLEAVDHVCTGDGIEHEAVLDLLSSLVDQSLVIAEGTEAGVRYRLLETVREYGLERLAEAGEEAAIRARHRDHFLTLAERADPHLETRRQLEFLELLGPEAANMAAAIDHALDTDPRLALRFSAALHRWWRARGRLVEAELAQSRSLVACGDREPELRARVLQRRASVAIISGDFEAGQSHATEALALADEVGDQGTAARARCELGRAMAYADPWAGRAELERAAELAQAAGDDWALVEAHQTVGEVYIYLDPGQASRASDEVSPLAEELGDPLQVARRWCHVCYIASLGGRLVEARDAAKRTHAAVEAVGEPLTEALADLALGVIDVWEAKPERALERLNRQLERAMTQGAGSAVPLLLGAIAVAELTLGRLDEARGRLEGVVPLLEGRWAYAASWALGLLAEALRLQADDAAEPTARRAQASGEELGSRLQATRPGLTLGRLAAARGEWTVAREHALAHLDACVEGGHATYVPPCLDALAEVAAGIEANEDAVRLLAAAERARAEIGVVRNPPEEEHWAGIEGRVREALGDAPYEAARAQGAELSTEETLEWARRARRPRRRPPGGWDSLTPTEEKVVELVGEGLTNPQIAERMFVSPVTVKTHVAHIFRKLDLHSRTELTAQAFERRNTEGSLNSRIEGGVRGEIPHLADVRRPGGYHSTPLAPTYAKAKERD
jgi:class 3 adenylate cyclase/DNA-binding CsgD family transcriptional regulator